MVTAAELDDGEDPRLDAYLYAELERQLLVHLSDPEILDRIDVIFAIRDPGLISTEQWYQLLEHELAGQQAKLVVALDRLYEQFLNTLEPAGRYRRGPCQGYFLLSLHWFY